MTDRANRYEPIFHQEAPRKQQLSADLPVVGPDACGTGSVSVHGLPYAQAMNQGADLPPRAAATMTLGDLLKAYPGGMVPPHQSEAAGWKHTSAAGHTIEIRNGTTPLATQVGGNHYKDMKIQPVEYIHANGIGYFEGSVIKYVSRWREKGGMADLEKAKHFIDLLLELERKKI